ncbi:MAG: Fatty acid hydroxylase-like protein [Bacteroidetes bacterium]|nr:Fatty acid hydroxylase-like protein [Bacteroidota bacterium]
MTIIFSFLIGVAFWTFMEYVLHRFLGHVHKGKNFFKEEHLQHHAKANYFAPAYKKAMAGLAASSILVAMLSLVMPFQVALAFILGFMGMYGVYEMVHYRFHTKDPIAMPFIILRKHHFYHHFHNPKTNHGVTTRFWDRVFGTFVRVEKVTVPSRMPLQWLLDGDDIKPAYARHFQLSSRQERKG